MSARMVRGLIGGEGALPCFSSFPLAPIDCCVAVAVNDATVPDLAWATCPELSAACHEEECSACALNSSAPRSKLSAVLCAAGVHVSTVEVRCRHSLPVVCGVAALPGVAAHERACGDVSCLCSCRSGQSYEQPPYACCHTVLSAAVTALCVLQTHLLGRHGCCAAGCNRGMVLVHTCVAVAVWQACASVNTAAVVVYVLCSDTWVILCQSMHVGLAPRANVLSHTAAMDCHIC